MSSVEGRFLNQLIIAMATGLPIVIGAAPGAHAGCKGSRGLPFGVAASVPKKLLRFQAEVENLANLAGFVTLLLNGASSQTSPHSAGA